ncbi:DUF1631 family protein [Roseateles chitinivorans]|uniref:DUF1631 family protein n=1 Tax=Roseateles chitinivorans TaxID=2917965 RepID=UPI003D6772CD
MMVQASSTSLAFLIDQTLAEVPTLAHAVYNGLQDELKDRLEHQYLLGCWNRHRARFIADLEDSLSQSLLIARTGGAPLPYQRPPQRDGELPLSLVDDAQVLKDVAIAHVTQAIEEHSRAELHQLGNFFAALRGIARPLKNDNPLRAALFAQALARTIDGVPVDADSRYALMRMAAPPLTASLHHLYSSLCQSLRAARLSGLLISHGSPSQGAERRQRQWGTVPDMTMRPAAPGSFAMSTPAVPQSDEDLQGREQHRQAWLRKLRSQLQRQLDHAQAGKLIRRFLLGPWIEVIAQVMIQHGEEASETRTCLGLVTTLLHSVSPQPDEAARERLRAQLPRLIEALNRGMDVIALPPMERKTFLDALMRRHGRALQLPGCLMSR